MTAEGWWVALILQHVCLSVPTFLSLPKLSSGAARTNLSGRWGAGFLHVTWETPRQHNLRPTMQCVWTLWNLNGESMQQHTWPRFSEESLCITPVCVYLLLGSFRRTLHLLFIPWNKAGRWQEHRLHTHTQKHCLTYTHRHAHKWASFCCWKVGNYGERGEGQLGFAYVVERRNYISHKARRWKWTSCPWFVDQIPSSWLWNHRIIRTKKFWATLFVPPLLFPRTEVILLPLPPSCLPCANVGCTVLYLFSFSHRKIRRIQPYPSKAVMWTPAFCLIYILRHSPSIPPLPAAPCQHRHPTAPTGFIKNAEFKLISDIWPFVKLFSSPSSASVEQDLIARRRLEYFSSGLVVRI